MFATFNSSMDARSSNSGSTMNRPKRSVAARACNRCRANRIKCDDNPQCEHCHARGLECFRGPSERDVETLRSRVSELEAQLQRVASVDLPATQATNQIPSPPDSLESSIDSRQPSSKPVARQWQGFWKANPHVDGLKYYGPTSFDFFIHRLGHFIERSRNLPHLSEVLQEAASFDQPQMRSTGQTVVESLTRQQEEGLLALFWQSYHSIFPIVDEEELSSHYMSLWPVPSSAITDREARKPSALVDIILALCMQHGLTPLLTGSPMLYNDATNTAWAGRNHYYRCQTHLQIQVSEPSIASLQCYIYSAVYQINASSFTAAHAALSAAVHLAQSLGIPHHPPDYLPDRRKSVRHRLWSSLYHLDSLLSLAMGRPHIVHISDGTLEVPASRHTLSGVATAASFEGTSWIVYHDESNRLLTTIRTITTSLSAKCTEILSKNDLETIYSDPSQIEVVASFLSQAIRPLHQWTRGVPVHLRLNRRDSNDPFSTSRCQVSFEKFPPLWLQRQRVLLELLYHIALQYLFRSFIRFPVPGSAPQPFGPAITTAADGNAVSALNHAMATVHIIQQALSETHLFISWHRAYQYLWESTLTIIAFTLARPLCPFTVSAHKAMNIGIQSLEIMASNGITAAARAARLAGELRSITGAAATTSEAASRSSTDYAPLPNSAMSSLPQMSSRAVSLDSNLPPLQSPLGSRESLSQFVNPTTAALSFDASQQIPDIVGLPFDDPSLMVLGPMPMIMNASTDFNDPFEVQHMGHWVQRLGYDRRDSGSQH